MCKHRPWTGALAAACCHLRLCFLINFVHPWPLPGTECSCAVRIFYCEIKWQRLSYPKTCLLLILPWPDGEMEPPSQHLQAWQTLCGLRGCRSLGHEPMGHPQVPEKRPIHGCVLGAKKPMPAHMPFSEQKEVPSRLVAPRKSRDDVVWTQTPETTCPSHPVLRPAFTMPAQC